MALYYKTLIYTCQSILLVVAGTSLAADVDDLPPLPVPVSNNAVAAVSAGGTEYLVSFSGLGAGRRHEDTMAATYVYSSITKAWSRAPDVPGGVGRLASVAAAVGGRAYVFGGYTVEADGSEVSTPWVHRFDPATHAFEERAAIPVPVDDAVAVTWSNRYVYLISGWHDSGNVNLVQVYDTVDDTWAQATPTPGPGVFGHAGGIVGNTIVYCDGVAIAPNPDRRRDFVATDRCFLGMIDSENPRRIDWRTLSAHPGAPRYRMAAGGDEALDAVVFVGGSDNPYNYNGIGYNGEPSAPSSGVMLYDVEHATWRVVEPGSKPTMDHRGLVTFADGLVTIGGMLSGQQTTDRVIVYRLMEQKKGGPVGPAQSH